MAHTLAQVLDYIGYMHGRGTDFAYHDFVASDVISPRVCRNGAVIFPDCWSERVRREWRSSNDLAIPDGQAAPVAAPPRDYARTGEFI